MKQIGDVAKRILDRAQQENAELRRRITAEGSTGVDFLEKRLPVLQKTISADCTIDELANHAPWELREAANRERLCAECPDGGGACHDADHPYYPPGRRPSWQMHDQLGMNHLVVVDCDKWKRYALSQAIEEAGVPPKFLEATLDNYEPNSPTQREALDTAQAFLENQDAHGLTIMGPTGLGKSHLAAGLLRASMQRGESAMFAYVPRLLELIRRELQEYGVSETQERTLSTQLLVIDDLGAERTTDFARERIEMIINHRWSHEKRLVVTQNCSYERLADLMGQPVVRRLVQISDYAVEIHGDFFE